MAKRKDFSDNFIRAMFLPDRCSLCGRPVVFRTKICKNCIKTAKFIKDKICPACGLPEKSCKCGKKANFYTSITAPFIYTGVVRQGISLWKFKKFYRNVDYFAEMIADSVTRNLDGENFDVITFIPQTKQESKKRTYNQGQILAEKTGEILNIPVMPLLTKLYETQRQHNLPHIARSGNIFGVFDVCNIPMTEGKKILLIDDIKTSGKTINECAKMLQLYNAESVHCAVIAIAEKQ